MSKDHRITTKQTSLVSGRAARVWHLANRHDSASSMPTVDALV